MIDRIRIWPLNKNLGLDIDWPLTSDQWPRQIGAFIFFSEIFKKQHYFINSFDTKIAKVEPVEDSQLFSSRKSRFWPEPEPEKVLDLTGTGSGKSPGS